MTVVLNEPGLIALLNSETGPVGRFTKAATELVAAEARRRVNAVTINMPFISGAVVGSQVTVTALGVEGEVGLTESGQTGTDFLLNKAKKEAGSGTNGDWAVASAKLLEPIWTVTT